METKSSKSSSLEAILLAFLIFLSILFVLQSFLGSFTDMKDKRVKRYDAARVCVNEELNALEQSLSPIQERIEAMEIRLPKVETDEISTGVVKFGGKR